MSEDGRTIWVGNLTDQVTEELLYELFLQAGPLMYVRQPKDKATGKRKNFAFVCYRHESSVPYSIALFSDIQLCGRNLRVQSRHLQELQAKGLASYDHGGVHSLDPSEDNNSPYPSRANSQNCHQQSLLGAVPGNNQQSLLGHIPGNIPPHILALAQQQMNLLNVNQPMPLTQNPLLNARMGPRDDRYGSAHNRNYQNYGEQSYGRNYSNNYGKESHSRKYSNNAGEQSQSYNRSYHDSGDQSYQRYNQYSRNSGGHRQVDNYTMQAMKMQSEDAIANNSDMLAGIQSRQGRFDKPRSGSRSYDHDNSRSYSQDSSRSYNNDNSRSYNQTNSRSYNQDTSRSYNQDNSRSYNQDSSRSYNQDNSRYQQDDYHRSSNRDHRREPYDRHDSSHDRNHNRQGSHDNRRRYDERSTGSHYRSNDSDRHARGHSYYKSRN